MLTGRLKATIWTIRVLTESFGVMKLVLVAIQSPEKFLCGFIQVFQKQRGNLIVKNGGFSVMFWGCFSRIAWGPLIEVQGTINGAKT